MLNNNLFNINPFTTSDHHLRLLIILYDFWSSFATSDHHLWLLITIYDFWSPFTTSDHPLISSNFTYKDRHLDETFVFSFEFSIISGRHFFMMKWRLNYQLLIWILFNFRTPFFYDEVKIKLPASHLNSPFNYRTPFFYDEVKIKLPASHLNFL